MVVPPARWLWFPVQVQSMRSPTLSPFLCGPSFQAVTCLVSGCCLRCTGVGFFSGFHRKEHAGSPRFWILRALASNLHFCGHWRSCFANKGEHHDIKKKIIIFWFFKEIEVTLQEHTQYCVYCGRPLFFKSAWDAMSCPDCEVQ